MEEVMKMQEGKDKKEEPEDKYEWGGGLVQKNKKAEMRAYEEREKAKPFARSIEDTEMNEMLQVR
jgi:hypothetical protein